MGNTPVTIGLRVNKSTCKAGDVVEGTVYVNISQASHPAQAIQISLFGREESVVHHTTEETDRRGDGRNHSTYTQDHYDRRTNDFLQMNHPLQTFATQQISRGQYEFPFCIPLPHNLPSSMECRRGESFCNVKYTLSATLKQPGRFTKNYTATQTLIMYAIPSDSYGVSGSTMLELPMEEVPVNTCCCHNHGSMALQARFDRTVVQPQSTIEVGFQGQNLSTMTVKRVRVSLEQVIEWKANSGNSKKVKRTLDFLELDAGRFPELAKLHRKGRRHSVPTTLNEWRSFSLKVSSDVQDSFQGRFITVRHVASVQLVTKGCCTTDPDAATLVQVFHHGVAADPPSPFASVPSAPVYEFDEADIYVTGEETSKPSAPSAPSAPYEPSAPSAPSAPPSDWDNVPQATAYSDSYQPMSYDSIATPMATAQVLPPDWNAETAEVVNIPMAQAVVLEPSAPMGPW